jgi:lipopolysaccharide transport system ATP-binding protein
MNEVGRAGRTILFVSHNLALLQSVCTHGLVLEAGKQIGFGTIDEALSLYQKRHLQSTAAERGTTDLLALPRGAGRQTCFKSALLKHSPEALPNQVFIEEEISLTLQAQLPEAASEDLHVLVRWTTELGATVFSLSSMFQHGPIDKARELAAQCTFKVPPLIAGIYYLSFELYSKGSIIDELPSALMLEVAHHDYYRLGFQLPTHLGSTLVKASWKINS